MPEPEAGLGVFVLPVETRLGPQWVRLSATQMFPWKGTLPARKEVVLAMARAQYERIAAARLNIHYQVEQAWLQLYELEKRAEVLQRSIDLLNTWESLALAKVEAGKAGLADVLRLQIRIRELTEEQRLLANQQAKPVATINRLLARPADMPVEAADTLTLVQPAFDRATLLADLREDHPMLRMYALQQEAARQSIELNRLEGRPSFGLGFDYILVGERTDADPDHNGRDILSPRVGVRIPLYRDKYRAKEQEERLRIQALESRKEDQFLQFRSELERAFTDWEDALLRYALYREQKETTRSAIDLLLTQYSANETGFVDLLQLEEQLVRYDLQLLSATVKSHLAQAEVERLIP